VASRVSDLTLDIAQFFANVRQKTLNHVNIQSQDTFGMCFMKILEFPADTRDLVFLAAVTVHFPGIVCNLNSA